MIYVFTGPTLSAAEAGQSLEAVYLPPAAQGDVYRAALDRPWVIAIIDGYFERVPSVWHKEILWAMSQGIHVYGAASMGALRAAELEVFGMVGVGEIFRAYRAGEIEDDDEVAVAHGLEDEGFRAHSEAMVDIRATLGRATREGILDGSESDRLEKTAKSLFYPRRGYSDILELALKAGMPTERGEAFQRWLAVGRVSQKREDALQLLNLLRRRFKSRPQKKRVGYPFHRTEIWERAILDTGRRPTPGAGGRGVDEAILDELRLQGREAYQARRDAALARALARQELTRLGLQPSEGSLRQTAARFQRKRRLADPAEVRGWLQEQDLTADDLDEALDSEARIGLARRLFDREIREQLARLLQLEGQFRMLRERATEKNASLTRRGLDDPDLSLANTDRGSLLKWFFENRLGAAIPDDIDEYARDLDLPGTDVLIQMILLEYLFRAKD